MDAAPHKPDAPAREPVANLIARLHAAPYRYVLAATGGGSAAAGWLLSVPGGSRTLLEVVIPYSEQALVEFLARRPASFCSAETSRDMAARAWQRARWLAPCVPTAGVGCTASLRSDRPKRGDHRFHLAVQTATHTATWSLTLAKEQRDREGEEEILDRVLLNAMAESFGIAERIAVPLLPGEEIHAEVEPAADPLAALLAGRVPVVCRESDGRLRTDAPRPGLLLPGSFNPLHEGHCRLAAVAANLVNRPAALELTVINADKPPLADEEVRRRLEQFTWRAPLWLTRAPTFTEKALLFPGAVFVVGADTAERIVQPRFYGSEERMAAALTAFREQGCRFLVAGRVDAAGAFRGLDDIPIPPAWRDLFAAIPADTFRMDISSTALRACHPACPLAGVSAPGPGG
jgi:nicotinic acid mononucleotide adenylyltransferase